MEYIFRLKKYYTIYLSLVFFLFLTSCSSDTEPRKAVISFNASKHEFDDVKIMLQQITENEGMLSTDSSYQFGTQDSPETRLIIHMKSDGSLEIFTNCYSD